MGKLIEVKAGDKLIAKSGYYGAGNLVTVDRVTPTQIVIGSSRYSKASGRMMGDGNYNNFRVIAPTPKNLLEVELEELHRKLCNLTSSSLKDVPIERLRIAVQAIEV
jgi:hypothetical protein